MPNIRGYFTKILRSAFRCSDPKSAKKTDGLTVCFVLLGSTCIKAAQKNVGEIDPRNKDTCCTKLQAYTLLH